ncbi:MAG: hypothetical protein IT291_10445 [Deltaproteobacteria bacterium]|nr:hypothetical protein [Deltaproteobacteria bacterium]
MLNRNKVEKIVEGIFKNSLNKDFRAPKKGLSKIVWERLTWSTGKTSQEVASNCGIEATSYTVMLANIMVDHEVYRRLKAAWSLKSDSIVDRVGLPASFVEAVKKNFRGTIPRESTFVDYIDTEGGPLRSVVCI